MNLPSAPAASALVGDAGGLSMLPGQSKGEVQAALRRDCREGMSNRALPCQYGVTWSTLNKDLASAWPQPRTTTASTRDLRSGIRSRR
ncbi:hypothetical protein [Streptomyces panaciradicis]|uniref:hypothetical protein n=1 Tax=Streptomyces panaciradicis TaxID=1470261 RepID=UPI00201D28D2|nr:hypothetical protein [Streptomyces panaciradicis]MCL6675179.1 hypothetical protein [Streptomyces panaciradicis]